MIIQGCAIAFLQSALYGMAGVSMLLTNRLMVGIGIGSVSMNLIRMLFLWLVNSKKIGALVFFSVSSAYLLCCFILSLVFVRSYKKAQAFNREIDSFLVNMTDHNSKVENAEYSKQKQR